MERSYPIRNGIAIPTCEIELPESRLDPENKYSFNNHHLNFTRREFGKLAILQTLRDLQVQQDRMPVDVHGWLHKYYAPPELPTPEQAMTEVLRAYDAKESMQIYNAIDKKYVLHPITDIHIKTLVAEYNSL